MNFPPKQREAVSMQGPLDAPRMRNIALEKDTQDHYNIAAIRYAVYEYHFLSVACCHNISIWYRFRDITTFSVYVTACYLEKSFTFDNKVQITSRMHFPIYV